MFFAPIVTTERIHQVTIFYYSKWKKSKIWYFAAIIIININIIIIIIIGMPPPTLFCFSPDDKNCAIYMFILVKCCPRVAFYSFLNNNFKILPSLSMICYFLLIQDVVNCISKSYEGFGTENKKYSILFCLIHIL
jgi:hypothetical protein